MSFYNVYRSVPLQQRQWSYCKRWSLPCRLAKRLWNSVTEMFVFMVNPLIWRPPIRVTEWSSFLMYPNTVGKGRDRFGRNKICSCWELGNDFLFDSFLLNNDLIFYPANVVCGGYGKLWMYFVIVFLALINNENDVLFFFIWHF